MQTRNWILSISVLIFGIIPVIGADFSGGIRNPEASWTYSFRKPSSVKLVSAGNKHGKCLLLNCVSGGVSVSRKVTLTQGQEYYLSFQYKFSDISPHVNLYVKFSPTNKVSWRLYPPNIYWTCFTGAFIAKSDKAEILITVGKKGQKVWLDDLRLTESYPLINNGGFENIGRAEPLRDWKFSTVSGKSQFFLSRNAYKGNFAAGIKNKGTAYINTIIRDIVPGYDYEIAGFYFSNDKCVPEIILTFIDVDAKLLSQSPPVKIILGNKGKWSAFKRIIHLPREVAGLCLSLGGTSVLNGQILWDNVSFKQIKSEE